MRFLLLLALFTTNAFALTNAELAQIGRKVWLNECDGTVSGLTSWNGGENFASLGIGHFIWAPHGVSIPFEESFPKLVRFLKTRGTVVPEWALGACPWNSRSEFQRAQQSARMETLRTMLANTIPEQAAFLAERSRLALPKMLAISTKPDLVRTRYEALGSTSRGTFALIDYVNFKGEGTLATERYGREGWGLLQVLETMRGHSVNDFSDAAAEVLTHRVHNAPADRHEERWLPGWKNRVARY